MGIIRISQGIEKNYLTGEQERFAISISKTKKERV